MICCNGRAEWPSGRVTFVLKSVVPASDPERLRYQPEPPAENLLHEEQEEDS
jgi:hypothetical protein